MWKKSQTRGDIIARSGTTFRAGTDKDDLRNQMEDANNRLRTGGGLLGKEATTLEMFTGNKKKNTSGKAHEVDGITGATVTSDGITKFLKRDLERYLKFLQNKDMVNVKE